MDRQRSMETGPPPAYTPKPSLLEPLSPQQSLAGPAHQRFLPGDDDHQLPADQQPLSPLLSPDASLPPTYTPLDEIIHTFTLRPPFIYATGSSTFPRYQLQAEYSKSGKPFRLRIRRLLGTESRRLSLASSTATSSSTASPPSSPQHATRRRSAAEVVYDDDTTLYTAENVSGIGLFSTSSAAPSTLDVRGRQRGTLPGYVRLSNSGSAGRARVWHVTRNPAGDSLRAENEKRMQRRGYKPADEVRQSLLFSVVSSPGGGGGGLRGGRTALEWRDDSGAALAREDGAAGALNVVQALDVRTRDILVMCWAAKAWANAPRDWTAGHGEKEDERPLRRAATAYT